MLLKVLPSCRVLTGTLAQPKIRSMRPRTRLVVSFLVFQIGFRIRRIWSTVMSSTGSFPMIGWAWSRKLLDHWKHAWRSTRWGREFQWRFLPHAGTSCGGFWLVGWRLLRLHVDQGISSAGYQHLKLKSALSGSRQRRDRERSQTHRPSPAIDRIAESKGSRTGGGDLQVETVAVMNQAGSTTVTMGLRGGNERS